MSKGKKSEEIIPSGKNPNSNMQVIIQKFEVKDFKMKISPSRRTSKTRVK